MIVYDVVQRSPEWYDVRLGVATASDYDRIVTSTGKPSAAIDGLVCEKLAEIFTGKPYGQIVTTDAMARGIELEPEAAEMYEFLSGTRTKSIGFITTDCGTFGASLDRLVEGGGAVEIKCPEPKTHINYLLNGPGKDYRQQVQGQIYVSGFEWVDFFSFCPGFPPVLLRQEKDMEYQDKMQAAMEEYKIALQRGIATLEKGGMVQAKPVGRKAGAASFYLTNYFYAG